MLFSTDAAHALQEVLPEGLHVLGSRDHGSETHDDDLISERSLSGLRRTLLGGYGALLR